MGNKIRDELTSDIDAEINQQFHTKFKEQVFEIKQSDGLSGSLQDECENDRGGHYE